MRSNTEVVVARRGKERRWEVHRQRVGLIWQLESDDCRNLGLTAEQRNAT